VEGVWSGSFQWVTQLTAEALRALTRITVSHVAQLSVVDLGPYYDAAGDAAISHVLKYLIDLTQGTDLSPTTEFAGGRHFEYLLQILACSH